MKQEERDQYVASLVRVKLNSDTNIRAGRFPGLYELEMPVPPLALDDFLHGSHRHTVFDIYTTATEEPHRLIAYEHLRPYITNQKKHIIRLADSRFMDIPDDCEDYPIMDFSDVKWKKLTVKEEVLGKFVRKMKAEFNLELSFRYGVPIENFYKFNLGRYRGSNFFVKNEKNLKGVYSYPSTLKYFSLASRIPFEQQKFWEQLVTSAKLLGLDHFYCTESSFHHFYPGWTSDYETQKRNPYLHETFFSTSELVDFGHGGGGGNYKQVCYGAIMFPPEAIGKVYSVKEDRFLTDEEAKRFTDVRSHGGWGDSVQDAIKLNKRMMKQYEKFDLHNPKFRDAHLAYHELADGIWEIQEEFKDCTPQDRDLDNLKEVILKTENHIGFIRVNVHPSQAYEKNTGFNRSRHNRVTVLDESQFVISFSDKDIESRANEIMKPYIKKYINAYNELSYDVQADEMVSKLNYCGS